MMMLMNTEPHSIEGRTKAIPIQLDTWKGLSDLLVATMDEFKIVLGNDFILKNRVVLLPFMKTVAMLRDNPCFLQASIQKP